MADYFDRNETLLGVINIYDPRHSDSDISPTEVLLFGATVAHTALDTALVRHLHRS